MNMNEIVNALMIGSTVAVGLFVALGMLLGLLKGWKNGVLTLCRLAASLLIAFGITKLLFAIVSPEAIRDLLLSSIKDLLATVGFGNADGLASFAGVITVSGAIPFVFTFIFVMIDLIMILPVYFIGRAFGIGVKPEKLEKRRKKKEEKRAARAAKAAAKKNEKMADTAAPADVTIDVKADGSAEVTTDEKPGEKAAENPVTAEKNKAKGKPAWSRLLGGAIRAGVAVITVLVIVLPVAGLMYCITDGMNEVVETAESVDADIPTGKQSVSFLGYNFTDEEGMLDYTGIHAVTSDIIEPVRNNIVFRAAYCAPFRTFYHSLSQANIDGHDYSLGDELGQLFSLLKYSVYFLDDLGDFGEDQIKAIDGITAYVSESELHAQIGAELLSQFSQNAINIYSDQIINGPHSTITEPLFRTLSNVTADSVVKDIDTIGEIGKIMIRYNVPYEVAVSIKTSSYNNFRSIVGNDELIYELLLAVFHNDDYRGLVSPGLSYAFEQLLIKFSVYDDITVAAEAGTMSDAELKEESKHLAAIFSNGMDAIESLGSAEGGNGAMDYLQKADIESLGRFLDAAEESALIGTGVRRMLVAVLKSGMLDNMRGVADIIVRHLEAGENLDMENLLTAVKRVTELLAIYQNSDGKTDVTEVTLTLNALVKSLSGSTGEIIKEIVNDSSVLNSSLLMGQTGGDNNYTQKLLSTMLDVMASEDFTREEIEREAKAVDYALKLVKASTDKSEAEGGMTSDQIKDIYNNDPEGIKDMVETMAESKLTTAAIKAIAYDENNNLNQDVLKLTEKVDEKDIETVKEKCKEYYVENVPDMSETDKAALEENIKAIAAIFGEDITTDIAEWDKLVSQNTGS